MKELLKDMFHAYLVTNNPEMIVNLPLSQTVEGYVRQQLELISDHLESLSESNLTRDQILTKCLARMTVSLKPSKYLHLKEILETEFTGDYLVMREAGIFTYELINLITVCTPIFKSFEFSLENQQNRILRYALIGQIREYLEATKL